MILPFSTQMNGKPTYFVSKIWQSLIPLFSEDSKGTPIFFYPKEYQECLDKNLLDWYKHDPKRHTIREDKKDRWKAGTKIDFFINCRQKDMFRFAPVLPVVSVQEVLMTYTHSDLIQISIDGRELFSYTERLEFAINDGFDNWEGFFHYFYPKIKAAPKEIYTPKLIHWTDLRY